MGATIQSFKEVWFSSSPNEWKALIFSLIPISFVNALKAERREIYVVKSGIDYLYVGEANTSIKTRFQRGFISHRYVEKNNKSRGGYKGYKWITDPKRAEDQILQIYVAVFSKAFDGDREYIEAIEGELV